MNPAKKHYQTPRLRLQELLQQQRELPEGEEHLPPADQMELVLLESITPYLDDLEDFANATRALNRVSDLAQQAIIKYYYYNQK